MSLGYTDPSIRIAIPVIVNKKPAVELLGGLVQYLNSNPVVVEDAVVLEQVTDFDSPLQTIQEKELPGFNDQTWIALSEDIYSKTAEFRNSHRVRQQEVVLRYAVQFFGEIRAPTLDMALLIGDFEELADTVGVLTGGSLWPLFDLDWRGLSTDPYSRTAFNFQMHRQDPKGIIISAVNPTYDAYCGKKWYCGADGSGLLTDVNLNWVAQQEPLKAVVTIGDLRRNSYLDDGLQTLGLYYRLTLATVAGCKPGAMAILKISLPINRGLYGIYSLFSLFFERVELISLKHWSPDDNTCYLIGIKCLQMPAAFMPFALRPNARNQILSYLTQDYNSLGNELTRALSPSIDRWIDEVTSDWSLRNVG